MKEKFGNDYFFATSKPIFLEIANKNVNKGKSIVRLGEIVGIKTEEMIAIGDGENDISMLQSAGYSIVMGNATDKVKEHADFITKSNIEDGVAYAIKTIIAKI